MRVCVQFYRVFVLTLLFIVVVVFYYHVGFTWHLIFTVKTSRERSFAADS